MVKCFCIIKTDFGTEILTTESETVTQVVKATVEAGAWSILAVTVVYVLFLSVYAVRVNCTPFIYENLPVTIVYS